MADVFVSYSSKDQGLADFVYRHLQMENIDVFMAAASLGPGDEWSETIKANLRSAKTVIILASRTAINAPFVLFEAGGAVFLNDKKSSPSFGTSSRVRCQHCSIGIKPSTFEDFRTRKRLLRTSRM